MNYGQRHEFLRSLHQLLRPATYLEIGVQTGRSLRLAGPDTSVVGIDPNPLTAPPVNGVIHAMTSDEFFATLPPCFAHRRGVAEMPIDLALIDGMHLIEFALRDFINVERYARPDGCTVAVFDDVLPYSAAIAGRTPLPDDWAGDVWKVAPLLAEFRPDLVCILVDVDPTGIMVVLGLDPAHAGRTQALYDELLVGNSPWFYDVPEMLPPDSPFITRSSAVQPDRAIEIINDHISYHLGG